LSKTIGVLALQGDYAKHAEVIRKLKYDTLFVRDITALKKCDALIIPGGESTTFLNLIDKLGLRKPLMEFGREKAIMGTCAGLIILAAKTDGLNFEPLKLIDLEVSRNAYGRQIDSFVADIELKINGAPARFEGVFIRAPKIVKVSPDVQPLAYYGDDIVMAANKNILVATFHPELTENLYIHNYFLTKFVS